MFSEKEFMTWLKSNGLSDRTLKEYNWYYRKLTEPYLTFNQKVVDEFLARWNNHVAKAFIKNVKEFLDRDGIEHSIPESDYQIIHRIKIKRGKRKVSAVPNTINKTQIGMIEQEMLSEGTKLMLLLTFFCGLRANELLHLKASNFDWDDWKRDMKQIGKLRFMGKGDRVDVVPVKPFLMMRLRNWINNTYTPESFDPEKPLFPVTYARWNKILEAASLKAIARKVNPHLIRHSWAIYLVENGWDINKIKSMLRHADIKTTQIYARISKKQLFEDYEKI